jgi:hypothetical protein
VDPSASYEISLEKLAQSRPRVAGPFQTAEELRASRLGRLLTGMRLSGLEQLLSYLDALYGYYNEYDSLAECAIHARTSR